MTGSSEPNYVPSRRREWLSFAFLTLILLPGLAVLFVGGYGFVVWMSHIINGPPVIGF
ncbi:periplasmic nitrate reductase, NapE protein [Shimia sp. Alg240-R146]|uniref:periplasmic nitrate reductase, NapE protein n=1 Tax=Shimia sp. Alg240-R146 TaxID=2993449 RepID=UPI0022E689CB|nr:periplasmic nitrate reductase, NapE protein [Shimia sp. Alg240-R146]